MQISVGIFSKNPAIKIPLQNPSKIEKNILWKYYSRKSSAISLTTMLKLITNNAQIWRKLETIYIKEKQE